MVQARQSGEADGFRFLALIDLVNEDALETNQARWREDDPFLALKSAGVRRYARAMSQRSDQPLFRPRSRLGVAEFWSDDEAGALQVYARLRDRALTKSHPLFRDARLTVLANREHYFIGGAAEANVEGLTALFFNKRKPAMPVADYQNHWLNVHGPLVIGAPGLARYLQMHRLPATYDGDETELDGAAELYWPDQAAYEAYGAAEDYQQRFRDDLPNLWDLRAGVRIFVEREEVFHEC